MNNYNRKRKKETQEGKKCSCIVVVFFGLLQFGDNNNKILLIFGISSDTCSKSFVQITLNDIKFQRFRTKLKRKNEHDNYNRHSKIRTSGFLIPEENLPRSIGSSAVRRNTDWSH